MAILGIMITGIVTGFTQSHRAAEWSGASLAAQSLAMQPIEITAKALTFALAGRLRKINAVPVLISPLSVTDAPESNPPALLAAANG